MNRLPGNIGPQQDPILISKVVARITPQTSNPLASFQTKYQGGSNGIQVDIVTGIAINALSIRLLRGFSRDPSQAKVVQTWNGPFPAQDSLEYSDTAPSVLAATRAYYWASIIYEASPTITQQQFGPQVAYVNAVSGGSEQIPAFSISITPDSGVLNVAVSFEQPSASDFGSAQLFVSGYNKIAAPQLIAQGSISPFTLTMEPTGEAVTFQLNAVTNSGQLVASGPTLQVTLNSTATIPAVIYNGTAISNTIGNQITFPGPAESNVTQLKVYRQNSGGSFSGSTLIATVAPSPEKSYTVTDQISSPQNYIYFVTATNSVGESNPSPPIIPGQATSSASQGSGATAVPYLAKYASDGTLDGESFLAAAPVTNQGSNYYAQPLVSITGSSKGHDAVGTAILDGAGHVTYIQLSDNGEYDSGDTVTVSIHY